MPITDFLRRNAELYGDEVALVEINPEEQEKHEKTWRDYELVERSQSLLLFFFDSVSHQL